MVRSQFQPRVASAEPLIAMATVIPFEDLVRSRHRQRQQVEMERCIEIIELNLRHTLDQFAAASEEERPLHARRLRNLSALLEYAVARQ